MTSREIVPLTAPPRVTLRPPGSKSITNRALLCAALAEGTSRLSGVLLADDTRAMLGAVAALGADVVLDEAACTATVTGTDPRRLTSSVAVDARQSGTTSRFLLPALALSPVPARLDGAEQLRARPFGPQVDALRALGATVVEDGAPGSLPLTVSGPLRGGTVSLPGHLSSQFLSGLLLAGPLLPEGLRVELTSAPVSLPYLELTRSVMEAFGVRLEPDGWAVRSGSYRATAYDVEPDASAASYLWAAAAVTGGTVTVDGLGSSSRQGDVAFVDLLARMGAEVEQTATSTTVRGTGVLHGIDVDMRDVSDTAQTLAAVAVFADSPTRITGIGFIRAKETDRIAAMVTELRRAGLDATEDADGFTVVPATPSPTTFATYDDHRMAMSLSLLGLRVPGVRIADPGCVAKTYPGFFDDLELMRGGRSALRA
ncbi:MAG: aroA [Frankiales bacterium]|nr:aroA [Frankiales bacterium]